MMLAETGSDYLRSNARTVLTVGYTTNPDKTAKQRVVRRKLRNVLQHQGQNQI